MGTNQWHCAANEEQWQQQQQQQQRQQQRGRTTIPLARQGCVTGIVVVIIIVLVTALAYVMAAVPGHVVSFVAVVTSFAPPTTLIVVLPRMCATDADADTTK